MQPLSPKAVFQFKGLHPFKFDKCLNLWEHHRELFKILGTSSVKFGNCRVFFFLPEFRGYMEKQRAKATDEWNISELANINWVINVTIATVTLSDFSTSFAPSPIQTNTWEKAKTSVITKLPNAATLLGNFINSSLKVRKAGVSYGKRQLNEFLLHV